MAHDDTPHLHRLQAYYARHQSFPAYARLGEILGMASKSAVHKLLHRLQALGFLDRSADGIWVPGERFFGRPFSEHPVLAGYPDMAGEHDAEPFYIDRYLVEDPGRTLLVPVRGDSMTNAGILDGDVVVVERCDHARAGALVIALIDGGYTLKRLAMEGSTPVLHPAHPDYPVLRPTHDFRIFGVVVGLVRKYRN